MPQTTKQELIELRLGRSLAGYVAARQSEGLGWRLIARDLTRDCGLTVSHESLRSWYGAEPTADAA